MKYKQALASCLVILSLLLSAPAVAAPANADDQRTRTPLIIEQAGGGCVELQVELAADAPSRRRGLMYRRHLPPQAGMLFDYGREQSVQMWMKNTRIPLDMLFVDGDGRIVHIVEQTEPGSHELIDSGQPVRAVLEVNAGFTARQGIRTGQLVRHAIFGNMPVR